MYDFEDLAEVQNVLEQMSAYEPPLVKQLSKRPGQKESRYMHLFVPVQEIETSVEEEEGSEHNHDLEERVHRLEEEVELLKEKLKDLL